MIRVSESCVQDRGSGVRVCVKSRDDLRQHGEVRVCGVVRVELLIGILTRPELSGDDVSST